MTLRLHDTMRRAVTDFIPLAPPRVTFYACGPTVYNYAHVGNFRTFLFEDVLRRWLEARRFDVFHISNLTDVDDKTIKGALAAGRTLREHVERYIAAFHEDRDWLGILPPHAEPRATEFVPRMIELVEGLLAKGVAYRGEDGSVYFSIARFPGYGRLSRLDARAPAPAAGSPRTSTPRRTRRTSSSGRRPGRTTSEWKRRGTRLSAGGGPGGISSARRWPWRSSGSDSACGRSTSTPAGWT
jgi:cysteinyl-tRNA synthetase